MAEKRGTVCSLGALVGREVEAVEAVEALSAFHEPSMVCSQGASSLPLELNATDHPPIHGRFMLAAP